MKKKANKNSLSLRLNKKVLAYLVILVIVLGVFGYYFSTRSFVAATVNGEKIYEKRVEALYNSLSKENRADQKVILQRLIETKILAQYVKSQGYYLDDTEFQNEIDKRLEASDSNINELVNELNLRGATLEDVRESIMIELFVNDVVVPEIQISVGEIAQYRFSTGSTLSDDDIRKVLLQQKTREVVAQIIQAEYKKATIVIEDKYK